MIFLKYLCYAFASILANIAGIVVVPVALLHGGLRSPLPAWASWWDNDREPFGDTARAPAIAAASGLKLFWLRFNWLAIRNPANNLGRELGVAYDDHAFVNRTGNQNTSDQGEQGVLFNTLHRHGNVIAFEFYYVKAWSKTRCVRIRLGWKLWDNPARLVHAINPFDSFTGKI